MGTVPKDYPSAGIKKGNKIMWPFSIYRLIYPKERYAWAQVRILHETDKAILVYNGRKFWIPKSRIYGVRLNNNIFEIYVKSRAFG